MELSIWNIFVLIIFRYTSIFCHCKPEVLIYLCDYLTLFNVAGRLRPHLAVQFYGVSRSHVNLTFLCTILLKSRNSSLTVRQCTTRGAAEFDLCSSSKLLPVQSICTGDGYGKSRTCPQSIEILIQALAIYDNIKTPIAY